MTIIIHELIATLCPELCCEASLPCRVGRLVEAGAGDLANPVPEQTTRSRALVLSRHSFAKVFPQLRARLDLPTPRPASPYVRGPAALQRCRRTFP